MDYNMIFNIITQIMILAGIIALFVSVVIEFGVKSIFNSLKTSQINGIATILSILVTFICLIAYMQIMQINISWYMYIFALFLGMIVGTISMNGYDKIFSYIYEWIKNIVKYISK